MMMGGEGMTVIAVPSFVEGVGDSPDIVTPPVSAVVTGGVGPFSYLWSFTEPDPQIGITSPVTSSTNFMGSSVFPGQVVSATAICTVTDTTTGQVESTGGVVVQITRFDV